MKRYSFLFSCILLIIASSDAQVDLVAVESDLAYHADIMINATEAKHRERAAAKFEELFVETLHLPSSFDYPMDSVKWISKLESPSGGFRLFSWVIEDADQISTPHGYIQMKDGSVIALQDNAMITTDSEFEITDATGWYGALYYNMLPFENGSQTDYILFGYRQISQYDKVKFLEVLTFENGKPIFGKEIFVKPQEDSRHEVRSRLVLTYSADASVTLNYNKGLGMIVFDNLISRMGRIPGQGPTLLPDGSYMAYKQNGDHWEYIDKLFTETSATAPRPQPVLGNKDNNLFGAKKDTGKKKKRN